MTTDTLSDVLRSVRLRGAVFYWISCGDEWTVEAPPAKEIAGAVSPGAEHVMEYHVITKGSGLLQCSHVGLSSSMESSQ